MSIAISSAHGKLIRGAKGVLDEVDESRRVVIEVTKILREADVTVVTFHDDTSTSQSANLNAIVGWHNRQQRRLDVSIHFNAYQKTDQPRGTEVCYKTQKELAAKVSKAMADAGTLINRGAKHRTNLAFLNKTTKPAILLEVCFVDSSADASLYRVNFDAICKAIADAIK